MGNTLMTAIDSMRSLMTEQERQADLASRLQSDIKVRMGDVTWMTGPSLLPRPHQCISMKVLEAARRRLEDSFDAKSRECDTARGKMKAMEDRQASSCLIYSQGFILARHINPSLQAAHLKEIQVERDHLQKQVKDLKRQQQQAEHASRRKDIEIQRKGAMNSMGTGEIEDKRRITRSSSSSGALGGGYEGPRRTAVPSSAYTESLTQVGLTVIQHGDDICHRKFGYFYYPNFVSSLVSL